MAGVAVRLTADFDYSQVSASSSLQAAVPGMIHKGFAKATAGLWPSLRSALQSIVTQGTKRQTAIKHVYVAGNSLGGGVATLVAYLAQVSVREE